LKNIGINIENGMEYVHVTVVENQDIKIKGLAKGDI
jgi:hypothetical protein